MKTSEMIALTDEYRKAMLPVELLQSMLLGDRWFEAGAILYIDKAKAKQLAAKRHGELIPSCEVLPDWFFDPTEKDHPDDPSVRVQLLRPLNILGVEYNGREVVVMDKRRAEYLSKENTVEVLPPLKRQEIEVATLDKEVETTTIKRRRKSATKTDSSSGKSRSKRSRPKKPSQD